jgi:hypothetical protein
LRFVKLVQEKATGLKELSLWTKGIEKRVQNKILVTGQFLGHEVCQVVLNNQDRNVQKVYRTECYNG